MSKTTIDQTAKAFVAGEEQTQPPETTQEEANSAPGSTYEELGASQWKALTSSDDPTDDALVALASSDNPSGSAVSALSPIIDTVSNNLEAATNQGCLGSTTVAQSTNMFDMQIKAPTKDECYNYFQTVDLPPSFSEAKALYPDESDPTGLEASLKQTSDYYNNYLLLLKTRKANIESLIASPTSGFTASDVGIARQFISKLEKGIVFTQTQMDQLSQYQTEYEKEQTTV